jgi:hypothetical protein
MMVADAAGVRSLRRPEILHPPAEGVSRAKDGQFAALRMSPVGTSRHFAAVRHFRRF